MSREQWGHGYWKGVEDATAGKVRLKFPDEVKYWVCQMCISNCNKSYDRTLFPVREFIWLCDFCGISERYAKKVYDYIILNEPFGCYVSGPANGSWDKDYFVLPVADKAHWQKIADEIATSFN